MRAVHVVSGGPAGVMATFAAMREGAPVRIFEKSAFPRHKVCGEFLSPAILPLLRRTGCEAGPLVFSERFRQPADEATYCAGDSLGFTDPFKDGRASSSGR